MDNPILSICPYSHSPKKNNLFILFCLRFALSLHSKTANKKIMLEIGLTHTSELTVTEAVTALSLGSGDMPVLATPAMMALMENAAMMAVADELPEGTTTVGGHIESSHLRPTKVGEKVRATAEVIKVDGKKIYFKVAAFAGDVLLGEGTHLRFVVDREKFLSKIL